ncbi:MAG TPA: condensation domain-containing protein, partial [Blastocatellia bacterium]
MESLELLKQRALKGDLEALQKLRDIGFFKKEERPQTNESASKSEIKREPLSYRQERLWLMNQSEPVSGSSLSYHNTPLILTLSGHIERHILEESINAVISRHDSLRSRFVNEPGAGVWITTPPAALKLEAIDLTDEPEERSMSRALVAALDEAKRAFDLQSELLIRASLFKLTDASHLLVITAHQAVADKESLRIIAKETAEIYSAKVAGRAPQLPALSLRFADYARWQRNIPANALEPLLFYWKGRVNDNPQPLKLPSYQSRRDASAYQEGRHAFSFGEKLSKQITVFCRQNGASEFAALLACFLTLLYRYTQQNEVAVGISDSGRNQKGTENVVGPFANFLVLRNSLKGSLTFRELLIRVNQTISQALHHKEMPYERLIQELKFDERINDRELFDAFYHYEDQQQPALRMGCAEARIIDADAAQGKQSISVFIRGGDEFSCAVVYNSNAYDAFTIKQLSRHFVSVIEAATLAPAQLIEEIALLDEAEQKQQLVAWNSTEARYERGKTLHELFEEQARKTPDLAAVTCAGESLLYRQLNERSNRLAHYLRRLAINSEARVGICMERSIEMVVGLLAILKAGSAYVPLDPAYPAEHLDFILEDARVRALLTTQDLIKRLPATDAALVCIDADWARMASEPDENPINQTTEDNLAYVIYTSGSTGKPKGAMIPHSGICNRLFWMQ